MISFRDRVRRYSKLYHQIRENGPARVCGLPGNCWFIENGEILTVPRDDGDCRYPYGRDGFNFWAYSSGYMHCNEGLFSPFLRPNEGQEPKIAFFAGFPDGNGRYSVFPLLSVPIAGTGNGAAEHYTVFSGSSAYYMTEVPGMRFAVRLFVREDREIDFDVDFENESEHPQELLFSSYFNPFLRHGIQENGESKWFREVRYLGGSQDQKLGSFLFQINEDLSRTLSVSNYGVLQRSVAFSQEGELLSHEETASRCQYVGGSRSSLHSPVPLTKGTFGNPRHVCAFTETAAAGDLLRMRLPSGSYAVYQTRFRYSVGLTGEPGPDLFFGEPAEKDNAEPRIETMEAEDARRSEGFECRMGAPEGWPVSGDLLDAFFNCLKKQVEFCSLIKGYVQFSEGSLIGIRDIFQALEALLIWQPDAARAKMLEALNYIFPDGRCPRQYSLPADENSMPVMDLRPFIDQGAWVISTAISYLKHTGDFAFLKEECGYYEIVDEKRRTVRKSARRDSVLSHLLRITDYLSRNRDIGGTECVYALYGDWNDALDGLGVSLEPGREYGTGVSVMASEQVYRNLLDMAGLLERLDGDRYASVIARYRKDARSLETGLRRCAVVENGRGGKKILHGWGDRESYRVGSFDDPDHRSRCSLTANAFWVLSGLYEKDTALKDAILNAFQQLDSKYGMKTFDPPFAPNTPGVGRIPKLPEGTAENGAVYVHASAFGVMALFRMGCPEKAFEQLYKLLPFTHERISCSPFVMPNSYGYNEEKKIDGESMLDWQTGSSNVVLKLLFRYVFGFEPDFDGIWIQPSAVIPYRSFEARARIRSKEIKLIYTRKGNERSFLVNGNPRAAVYDPVMKLRKIWIGGEELSRTDSFLIRIRD